MDESGLQQVDRQRQELEKNVSELRKSFQHWQTWEVDYEGLREEITRLPETTSSENILTVARDFGAELVDEVELQKLVYKDGGSPRAKDQIANMLQKRLDYVTRNAQTIEKQFKEAQKRRDALPLAENPDYEHEVGLPLMDITEVLDDNGNVVSGKVEPATPSASQLVDVLTQVGVTDVIEQDGIITSSAVKDEEPVPDLAGSQTDVEQEVKKPLTTVLKSDGSQAQSHVINSLSESEVIQTSSETTTESMLKNAVNAGNILQATDSDNGADSDEEDIGPTNPDDTPEEAALRRQMLRYGMGEVGAIVAELELEEGSDAEYDDDDSLSMEEVEDEDLDDEEGSDDENGLVKHPTMSKKYLDKMKQLQDKYGIQGMQNLGPDTSKLPKDVQDGLSRPSEAQAARKAVLAREASKDTLDSSNPARFSSKSKKKVAFAGELDIAPRSTTNPEPSKSPSSKPRPTPISVTDPVKSTIIEHPSTPNNILSPTTSKKPSRFKSTRSNTPQTPLYPPTLPSPSPPLSSQPNPPPHALQASTIIERPPSTSSAAPSAPDPSDIDAALHAREVAADYYALRNRLIARQDGFVGGGEAEDYGEQEGPLMYRDAEGREKKVSRFLAARLK